MDKKIIKIGLAMMTCMSVLWSDSKLLLADETDNITNEMEIDTTVSQNLAADFKPASFTELQNAIQSANENAVIDLSDLSSDNNNHSYTIDKSLTLTGSNNTIEGLYLYVKADKTLTLSNVTIVGHYANSRAKGTTVEGEKGANLIVEHDAKLIGSSYASSFFSYMSGVAIRGFKEVLIYGEVESGQGVKKIEGGAIHNCYHVVIDGGSVKGGVIDEKVTLRGAADNPLISYVNKLEIKNASIIGCVDKDKDSSGGSLISATYNAIIENSTVIPAEVSFPYGVIDIESTDSFNSHMYERDCAIGFSISDTSIIIPDSAYEEIVEMDSDMYDAGSCDKIAGYVLKISTLSDFNISPYDDVSPIVNIGENVTLQGLNSSGSNGGAAIIADSNYLPVIVNVAASAEIIGGSTTFENGYGGNGITGAQVNVDGIVRGGNGTYGGYGVSRCWSDSVFNTNGQISGGTGSVLGGHAVYNASKITVNGATLSGGNGPAYQPGDADGNGFQRAGSAVYSVDKLIMNDGELKPGSGGYAACVVGSLYMKGGLILNSSSHFEAQPDDLNLASVLLYNVPAMLQISGGSIGYINTEVNGAITETVSVGLWNEKNTNYWTYRKEDKSVQWQDSIFSGAGYQLFADEVICDGENITVDDNQQNVSNIYSKFGKVNETAEGTALVYSPDTVEVIFPRSITDEDEIIFSARNWSKENGPYEPLDLSYTLISDTKITFTQPKRSIRIELRKKEAILDLNKTDNEISGIEIDAEFKTGESITFTAIGANLNHSKPGLNDLRYVPTSWSVNPNGTWDKEPYTAAFKIDNEGDYTLRVIFDEEQYIQTDEWIKTGKSIEKSISFTIKGKAASESSSTGSTYNPHKNCFAVKADSHVVEYIKTPVKSLGQYGLNYQLSYLGKDGKPVKKTWIILNQEGNLVETSTAVSFDQQYDDSYRIYWADEAGVLADSWRLLGGNWYYFNTDYTARASQWQAHNLDWYYFQNYTYVRNYWLPSSEGRWYYFDGEGRMVRNQEVDGCWINSYGIYWSPLYTDPEYAAAYSE